jgi:hypothetical protein
MNDHFASILHEDRMNEYRGYARAASSVTKARRETVKRRATRLDRTAFAATLALLACIGAFILQTVA